MQCWRFIALSIVRPARSGWIALLAALSLAALGGCGPAAGTHEEHDHAAHEEDDVPITEADVVMPRDFVAAVARLRDYRRQVFAAIASGKPARAHRPLDELDLVIGKIMPLARDSGVPRGEWEEVNLARRALRAQFDLVHAAIDGGEQPDVKAAEPATAAELARLEAVAGKLVHEPAKRISHDSQTPASQEASP